MPLSLLIHSLKTECQIFIRIIATSRGFAPRDGIFKFISTLESNIFSVPSLLSNGDWSSKCPYQCSLTVWWGVPNEASSGDNDNDEFAREVLVVVAIRVHVLARKHRPVPPSASACDITRDRVSLVPFKGY